MSEKLSFEEKYLKILQVSSYYAPAFSFGGPPRVMYDLARGLAQRGNQVSVYTSDALDIRETDKRISTARETIEGIRITRFPRLNPRLPSKFLRVIVKGFRKEIAEQVRDYDAVHLSEVRNYMNTTAARVCQDAKVPYFISIFGNLATQKSFHKRLLIDLYDTIWTKKMFGMSAGLLVQNKHEKEACLKYGIEPSLIKFSPLPVQFSNFKDLPARGLFRKKFGISPEAKIIISLGRLHRDKGFQSLLSSFASLPERKDTILIIVGADEGYGEALKKQAGDLKVKDRVIFPGALYNRAKLEAFVDSDIFALIPLVYEETSLASLEACASGLPVIVSVKDSIPWLEEYSAGIEIARDGKELTQVLQLLLSDDKKRKEMGQRARTLIQEKFAVERVVEEMEGMFRKAVNSKQ